MTHCDGYRAAAVARSRDLASIGIDAEPHSPLPGGVLDLVSVTKDPPILQAIKRLGVHGDRLLFSAKESVYKTWFPLTKRWLGFKDVTVALRLDGTFTARLLVDGAAYPSRAMTELDGRWLTDRDTVLTSVTVPGHPDLRLARG